MQKFKKGDKVKIINYGSKMMIAKNGYKEASRSVLQLMKSSEHFLFCGEELSAEALETIQGQEQPANILQEGETHWIVDSHPEYIGKTAMVVGSYHDLFGSEGEEEEEEQRLINMKDYTLEGIKGKVAWYKEDQLELI